MLKKIVKYGIFITISLFLLKRSYKGFELGEIWHGVKASKLEWILFALISNVISHVFRAARWQILMRPLKFRPSLFNTFICDLSGLFVNIFLPRLGEVFRCTALKRVENISVASSLTTVVVERLMDVFVFVFIVIVACFCLTSKMKNILDMLSFKGVIPGTTLILIFLVVIVLLALLFFIFRKKILGYRRKVILGIVFIKRTLKEMLKNEKKIEILVYTFFIWLLYFLSIYLLFFSIYGTSHLGIDAGLILLIAGSLGLAAPVQGGGAGAVHFFIIGALAIFNISKQDAVLLATLIHGVQFITALIFGGLAMIVTFIMKKF